ncbi:MAG: LysM peptidoglycan-binding domain-containing protein, partial [Deltaproteobacteria bacterium]|nr:LysM peptidoglycan-binding domain-containing protein [Deltaproteobacteria bacterium]
RSGDCISTIAERHRMTVGELLKLNNLNEKDTIYAGQVLAVRR